MLRPLAILFILLLPQLSRAEETLHVTATKDTLVLAGDFPTAHEIAETPPYDSAGKGVPVTRAGPGKFSIAIPRFDSTRDRIYSAFAAPGVAPRFVEEMDAVASNDEPYPVTTSKKGLQVADVNDALALGIHHAALNVWLNAYIDLADHKTAVEFQCDGKPFHFRRGAVEGLDRQIKSLSDAGVIVSLILLYHRSGDPALDQLMLHPSYDPTAPNKLSAFNVTNEQSTEELKACFEFLAERYSRPDRAHGRALNFIVGNEVDSHWFWFNLGHADVATVAEQYARAVRLCHTAVRKYSTAGRVFISLDHFWNMRYPAGDSKQDCGGRELVERFHQILLDGGDIDWNIAYHPYPENLFDPRFWRDKTATPRDDTPRITFKNIELLPKYLKRPEMLYQGRPRHVILSEQGFHSSDKPDGESLQAAAFACAYYRVDRISGIDAFILHRHIDAIGEGGLHLGLWWDTNTNPHGSMRAKKQIYEVFRAADTDHWREAFQFALPIVGIKSWDEVDPIPF